MHPLHANGNPQGHIFWLNGMAGTGKSTIAQTIAHRYHDANLLGASFFCSRDNADRSNSNMIFPTIAYQLCLFQPILREHVSRAMRKDPDLSFAFPSMQLEKLIVEPLEAVMRLQAFQPCLIVIDALDECNEDSTSTVLTALGLLIGRLVPLRFFVTSRPAPIVERGFFLTGLMRDTNMLALHSIPFDISQKDVHVYLRGWLSAIARSFGLERWPSSEALVRLAELSMGIFIFAATTADFIEDIDVCDPRQQLKVILSSRYIASSKTSPYRPLDALYLTALREAFPDISSNLRARLKVVLASISLLFDSLSPESLEGLLDLSENTVRSTLSRLHSIVITPEPGCGPVRLLHPSMCHFITDIDRCDDLNFFVDAQLLHSTLAQSCLRVLQSLSPDLCHIGDSSLFNQGVCDVQTRIADHIPSHVQYACRYWASHLINSEVEPETLSLLLRFCSSQLLNWLEVMSLLGELNNSMAALHSAQSIIQVRTFQDSLRD